MELFYEFMYTVITVLYIVLSLGGFILKYIKQKASWWHQHAFLPQEEDFYVIIGVI